MNRIFKLQEQARKNDEFNEAQVRPHHIGYLPNGVGRWRQNNQPIRPLIPPFNQHPLIRVPRHHQNELRREAVNRMIKRGDVSENFPPFHNFYAYSIPNVNRQFDRTTGVSFNPEDTGGIQTTDPVPQDFDEDVD